MRRRRKEIPEKRKEKKTVRIGFLFIQFHCYSVAEADWFLLSPVIYLIVRNSPKEQLAPSDSKLQPTWAK